MHKNLWYLFGICLLCFNLLLFCNRKIYNGLYQVPRCQLKHVNGSEHSFSLYYSGRQKYYDHKVSPNRFHFEKEYFVVNESQQIHAIITTIGFKLTPQFNHTLSYLNYLYKKYGIRSVIITENVDVSRRCMELGLSTEPFQEVNRFGMPVFKSTLLYIQDHYESDLYVYTNNVLINPYVLLLAQSMQNDFSKPFVFTGRATIIQPIDQPIDQFDFNTFIDLGSRRVRQQGSFEMDYFIFNKNYPFELMSSQVIGRPVVNNAVMLLAHSMASHVVDFTQIESFKEDGDKLICSDCSVRDLNWNTRTSFSKTTRKYGSLASNFYIRVYQPNSKVLFSSKILEQSFQTFDNIPDNY